MKIVEYFKILTKEIHSVVVATLDADALPSTRVIDMMLYDEEGVYFLTAKGKAFYEQLQNNSYISLSGMTNGFDTMQKKAISMSGFVKNIKSKKLEQIFKQNPYMAKIYPTIESRKVLEVFHIYKAKGEFFDLSTKPITRESFAFGGEKVSKHGFFITDACKECAECEEKCPQECIDIGTPFKINQESCLHCGHCFEVCPNDAIIKTS